MNNLSPSSNKVSPKTPGGISKSLLTPCRRVGLSRKWRKSGCSPFISPLSGQNATPERTPAQEGKRRKPSDQLEQTEINNESASDQFEISQNSSLNLLMSCNVNEENNDITSTPSRNTYLPRKKSKTLALKNNHETANELLSATNQLKHKPFQSDESHTNDFNVLEYKNQNKDKTHHPEVIKTPSKQKSIEKISKPIRADSKSKLSLKKSHSKSDSINKTKEPLVLNVENNESKKLSPNKLTKECIVVIQKKILKTDQAIIPTETEKDIQDVDLEPDVPLSEIKKENLNKVTLNTLDDDDFNQPVKKAIRNLSIKRKKGELNQYHSSNSSQSSQDSIDKRTIIVKKTYNKVMKPLKAKSTGSITQKDVDELKARIEMKQKLLLAKAMSVDTEELRSLIKKWQKGCQDALMELLDLMKKKLPDRQNMDYSEILTTLKIPADLVGYDSENDCFVTPDDTKMILTAFKL